MVRTYNKKTKPKSNTALIITFLIATIIVVFYISRYTNHTSEIVYPEYTGEPYVVINSNIPYFSEEEKRTQTFEKYSDLDYLGRCGNVSKDTMPTEERGQIGMVKLSGWHPVC